MAQYRTALTLLGGDDQRHGAYLLGLGEAERRVEASYARSLLCVITGSHGSAKRASCKHTSPMC